MEKKLQRLQNDKMIAGVASGLAEHLNVDPVLIRVGFVLAVMAGFSGILIYVILWIAMPAKPYVPLNADYKVNPSYKDQGTGYVVFGAILICIGMYFLLDELDFIPYWINLNKLWPLAIIIPGIMILVKSMQPDASHNASDTTWDKEQKETGADNETNNDQTI